MPRGHSRSPWGDLVPGGVGVRRWRLRRRRCPAPSHSGDPPGADVLEAVALDVARLPVLLERVERRAAVGDLGLAAGSPDGPEAAHAGRLRPFPNDERRPERETGGVLADESAVLLDAERVERPAPAVDENRLAERLVLRGHYHARAVGTGAVRACGVERRDDAC